jgi:hypothetical protein
VRLQVVTSIPLGLLEGQSLRSKTKRFGKERALCICKWAKILFRLQCMADHVTTSDYASPVVPCNNFN